MDSETAAMLAWRHRRSKRAALAALLICSLVMSGAAAAAQQAPVCPPSRTPIKLNFKTLTPAPIHNHRLTVQGIANLLRSQGQPAPAGERALGITLTKTVFGLQGATSAIKRGNGFCVYLSEVDVDFGWNRVEVYVPSEFPEGSCEYRVVLDHENQHVSINRTLLREFAPQMRARLETILATTKPMFRRTLDGSADAAIEHLNVQLSGMLKEFDALHASRNAGIDSPASYSALSALCKDWNRGNEPSPK